MHNNGGYRIHPTRLTKKQRIVLDLIRKGNPDGGFIDQEILHGMLPWQACKQALQAQIRALESRGFVERWQERRRGASRTCYRLTLAGLRLFNTLPDVVDIDLQKLDPAVFE